VTTNESLIDLHADLVSILPDTIHGSDNKASKSNFLPTNEALHCKFIRYGTKKTFKILMFDIDNAKGTVEAYHEHIFNTIGIYPTFTLKTDNGFHFGLMLDKTVWRTQYDSTAATVEAQIASSLKEKITLALNGDIHGSKRLIGIWRKPLLHKRTYTGNVFNLLELAKQFNIAEPVRSTIISTSNINTKMKMSSSNKIEDTIKNDFVEGNRNNYLFAIGFKIVYQDRSKVSTIQDELQQINDSHSNGLTEYEVRKISESILKLEPTMFNPKREIVRGKLSDEMWEKNIHGLSNRRSYAGYKTALNRSITTAVNVTESLIKLFERGISTPTNKQVSELANISVRQLQRIKHKVEREQVFLLWLNKVLDNIDIRAYVIPLITRVWKRLESITQTIKAVEKVLDYSNYEQKPIAYKQNSVSNYTVLARCIYN